MGFLESICMSARASATASPRGMGIAYLFFAVLPDALGLDLVADLTACFFAAGFIVVFLATGFLVAACLATGLWVLATCRAGALCVECDACDT